MKKKIFGLALLCMMYVHECPSQYMFKGRVSNEEGMGLLGVHIQTQKYGRGTTSDDRGYFELNCPDSILLLQFSYTGFQSVERKANLSDFINVVLKEGVMLEEAVVTALGIQKKERSLAYAVEKIKGTELQVVPAANFENLLTGKAAGLMVMGSSGGNPGGSTRILLRGVRSIFGENQALFVVDGIPMDNSNFTNDAQILANGSGNVYESQRDYGNVIQDLNAEDIAELSILKGPSAAALYGSRGANGVILVKTKQADNVKKGLGIEVNSSITFDKISTFPDFQRTYGGGVNLFPKGYADGSGFYKIPFIEFNGEGDTVGKFLSFDLIPIYGVDESNGTRFQITTDEHFRNLDAMTIGEKEKDRYAFTNGYGTNQNGLYYRKWNSWDSWDAKHFGQNELWEAGDDPRKFFETGLTTRFHVALNQAVEELKYRLSYTRFNQKGIYPNSNLGKHSFGWNGSMQLHPKLNVETTAHYIHSDNTGRPATTYDYRGGFNPAQNFSQWWQTQLRFDELKTYENPDGSMRSWNRQSETNPRPQYWDNPYWTRYKNFSRDGRDRFYGLVALNYHIAQGLKISGRVLNDQYHEQREERIAEGSLLQSQYTQDLYDVRETNTDCILRYEQQLNERLFVSGFAGVNKLWSRTERNFGASIGGLAVPGIYKLQNSTERPIVQNYLFRKEIESLFGGISLEWNRYLYIDITGRNDWSSTLPAQQNGYFYPAASLAYVFSEHLDLPFLSFGKLRLSWADVGGDASPYSIFTTYLGNPNFGNLPNYTVSNTLNNLNLKPEQTQSIEAGVDLRTLEGRLGLDLTVYSATTNDQIIPLSTSSSTGFTRQLINAGKIRNRGIELSIYSSVVRSKDFEWKSSIHFGTNSNEVISIIPSDPSITNIPLASPGGITVNAFIGEAYGTILGTNYIFDKQGNKLIDPNTGYYLKSPGVMPIGNINPDFTGGWSNSLQWKNISLSLLIDFRKGGDIFSVTNAFGRYSGLLKSTTENNIRENGYIFDGVVAILDSKGMPILESDGNTQNLLDDTYQSTGVKNTKAVPYNDYKWVAGGYFLNKQDLYDGSFIKLRELTITYRLTGKWMEKLGLNQARVGIYARNLWTILKNIPNIDPEIISNTSNIQGNEGGAVPGTRSFGFNLNFNF